jgi:hypothetical protein
VIFLVRRWDESTAAWWNDVAAADDAPVIVQELLRGESVICDRPEADEALTWARRRLHWDDGAAALYVRET